MGGSTYYDYDYDFFKLFEVGKRGSEGKTERADRSDKEERGTTLIRVKGG